MLALLVFIAADPCALRAFADKPSAELLPLIAKAGDARAKACIDVVAANALSREGHGSDAAALYDEASVSLVDVASFLDIAKKRALAPPAPPPGLVDDRVAPASADAAAERVQALLRAAKPKRAAALALAFPRGPAGSTAHEGLEVATVTALVRAGRIDEALARAASLPASDAFVKVHAWALSKAKRFAEARDRYAALATSTTDPSLKAEAAFYAGFSSYEAGDLVDARARLSASADVLAGSPFEAFARWYGAFTFLLEGKPKEAVPILDKLVKDLPSDKEALKHRYWLGRAKLDAGDVAGGKRELAAVAELEPTDYYGLLARRRLKRAPLKGALVPAGALEKIARDDDDARRVKLLWQLGLDDEARTLARSLGETAADIGLQQSVDDAHFGYRRGAKFIPVPRARSGALVNDARWRVSYAAPWPALVDAAAKKASVPSSFLYAIMRTESGFDAHAVSVAGAQGVIQLLPSAARGACALSGRPVDDAARIFEAPVAIDLGAALLGQERKEFGSLALAAAAYNGAAPNVALWMKDYGALEPELFVERIPFRETRDYVKRVLAVEATYRALDGSPLTLELPEKIPQAPEKLTDFPVDE